MAIASNFPSSRPSLLLDFASVGRLDPRVTFARASSGTYYDGVTTAKAEENLLLYSQGFDNAYYSKLRATVGANAANAPDGTATADSLTQASGETTAGAIYPAANIAYLASTYVFSVFAKPNGKNFIRLAMVDGGSTFRECYFDINNGTVGTANNGAVGTITASADGYYRCSIAYTFSSASTMSPRIFLADTDNSTVVVDSGGVYLWGAQLEQRSAVTAYTATTTQPITNYIPVLQTAAAGVPRFQHDPVTGVAEGLLIEEQRTNLMTYSEDFSNAAWTKTDSSVTSNIIVAPDGTLTGEKIVSDASTLGRVTQQISLTSGTTYTLSVYAKAAEYNFCQLRIDNAVGSITRAYFNLSNGTVDSTSNSTATITPVGNGWYRCTMTYAATITTSGGQRIYGQLDASDTVGDGYSGIYIWGADIQAEAFPTSYIPTTSASVTRSADAASMTGTNFSSWFNNAEGTLFAEANTPEFAAAYVFADMNSNSLTNYIRQSTASNGTNNQFILSDSGTTTASPGVVVTLGSMRKVAGAYIVNSVQQSVNGSLGTEDTSATVPAGLTQLNIGSRSTGANAVNGTIRKIAYYPQRLTNAQLQALTG